MTHSTSTADGSGWRPGPAWLFCPADRPDRYVKALAIADIVVLDLEDAVSLEHKAEARRCVSTLVQDQMFDRDRSILRINAAGSDHHAEDVALLRETRIHRVMLAKTETPAQIDALRADARSADARSADARSADARSADARSADKESVSGIEIIALLETAAGIDRASEIAAADGVVAVMWGADDLIASMGGSSSRRADASYRDVARFARSRSLLGTKAAGRLAIDAVYMAIPDHAGLRAECEDAVAVGFDAKVAIHPDQVSVIRDAYRPSTESVDWARRLLEHVGANRGVTTFEGRMVDGPIYAQAEQILRRAGSA